MLTTAVIQNLARSLDYDPPNPISPHQLMALNILLQQFSTNRQERLALASKLLGTAISSTKLLTQGQASAILKVAYPIRCSLTESSKWMRSSFRLCQI